MKHFLNYINEALIKNHAKSSDKDDFFKLNYYRTTPLHTGKSIYEFKSNILKSNKKIKEYFKEKVLKKYSSYEKYQCTNYSLVVRYCKHNKGSVGNYYYTYIILYYNKKDKLGTWSLSKSEESDLLPKTYINIIEKTIAEIDEKNN